MLDGGSRWEVLRHWSLLHGADMAIACTILPVIQGVAPAREGPSKCHSSVQWSPGSLALHGTLHGSIASKPVYCNGNIFLGFVERVFTRNPHSSSLFQRTSCPFPPFPLESTIILRYIVLEQFSYSISLALFQKIGAMDTSTTPKQHVLFTCCVQANLQALNLPGAPLSVPHHSAA